MSDEYFEQVKDLRYLRLLRRDYEQRKAIDDEQRSKGLLHTWETPLTQMRYNYVEYGDDKLKEIYE